MPKQRICNLIKIATSDSLSDEDVVFPLHQKCINNVNKDIGMNLFGYSCRIHCDEIRHVKRKHPSDMRYLCFIPDILKNYDSVKKEFEFDQKSKQRALFFLFQKSFNGDIVKLVKVRITKDKTINLKTMFVKNKVVQ